MLACADLRFQAGSLGVVGHGGRGSRSGEGIWEIARLSMHGEIRNGSVETKTGCHWQRNAERRSPANNEGRWAECLISSRAQGVHPKRLRISDEIVFLSYLLWLLLVSRDRLREWSKQDLWARHIRRNREIAFLLMAEVSPEVNDGARDCGNHKLAMLVQSRGITANRKCAWAPRNSTGRRLITARGCTVGLLTRVLEELGRPQPQ